MAAEAVMCRTMACNAREGTDLMCFAGWQHEGWVAAQAAMGLHGVPQK